MATRGASGGFFDGEMKRKSPRFGYDDVERILYMCIVLIVVVSRLHCDIKRIRGGVRDERTIDPAATKTGKSHTCQRGAVPNLIKRLPPHPFLLFPPTTTFTLSPLRSSLSLLLLLPPHHVSSQSQLKSSLQQHRQADNTHSPFNFFLIHYSPNRSHSFLTPDYHRHRRRLTSTQGPYIKRVEQGQVSFKANRQNHFCARKESHTSFVSLSPASRSFDSPVLSVDKPPTLPIQKEQQPVGSQSTPNEVPTPSLTHLYKNLPQHHQPSLLVTPQPKEKEKNNVSPNALSPTNLGLPPPSTHSSLPAADPLQHHDPIHLFTSHPNADRPFARHPIHVHVPRGYGHRKLAVPALQLVGRMDGALVERVRAGRG